MCFAPAVVIRPARFLLFKLKCGRWKLNACASGRSQVYLRFYSERSQVSMPRIGGVSHYPLLQEYKVYGKHKEYHCHKVVPLERLSFEEYRYYYAEHKARDYFLYNFQLYQ